MDARRLFLGDTADIWRGSDGAFMAAFGNVVLEVVFLVILRFSDGGRCYHRAAILFSFSYYSKPKETLSVLKEQ